MKSVQLLWHPPTQYIGSDISYVCVPFVEIGNIAGVVEVTTRTYLTFPDLTQSMFPFLNFPVFLLSLGTVLNHYYDVWQLANSEMRRLMPLTFY